VNQKGIGMGAIIGVIFVIIALNTFFDAFIDYIV
jgi:hypothetical protein